MSVDILSVDILASKLSLEFGSSLIILFVKYHLRQWIW